MSGTVFTFDFDDVAPLVTSAEVEVEMLNGNPDPLPQKILVGKPLAKGTPIYQWLSDRRNGTSYLLTCRAVAENGERYIDTTRFLVMSEE